MKPSVTISHGHPVAKISPVSIGANQLPSWKRPGLKMVIKGGGLSNIIREERHRQGYARKPVSKKEFSVWEPEQAWDGK